MALVSKTISGFWNGISQQAPTARRENQCEAQENVLGTLVDGLIKRPNTEFMTLLSSNASTGCFIHRINRDLNDRYIVIITSNTTDPIEVYKVDGTKCTVLYENADAKAYVTNAKPATTFKAVTVADHTFIANNTYTIWPDDDALSGGTLTGTVQSYADLPETPGVGAIYQIVGDPNTNFDNFYMYYTGSVWQETIKPGIEYRFNAKTMPHKLVQTDTNKFTLSSCVWGECTTGDTESNPWPTFTWNKISGLFFYKNRLGFLSRDNVILSRAGGYYDFFRKSALDIHDDDPIDTSASAKEIQMLRSVAVFDKSLMLLSDQQQFDLSADGGPLGPKTVSITPTTAFPIDSNSEPVTAGANVYFISPKDSFMSLREYFIQPDSLTNDAADVTAHVPNFIPYGTCTLETVNSLDMVFVHTSGDPDAIYVYKYFWNGEEKAQSAWSRWTFDGEILGFSAIDTILYIVFKRNAEISLEKIHLENANTGGLPFHIHLDRLCTVTGTYNSSTDMTTWELNYATSTDVPLEVVDPDTGLPLSSLTRPDVDTVARAGDFSAKAYYIGRNYESKFIPSQWYVKAGNGQSITSGRLQIRSFTLEFTNSGPFKVKVYGLGRDTDSPNSKTLIMTHTYSGVVLGTTLIGQASLRDGKKKFLVMGNARTTEVAIVSDNYFPFAFQGGAWEGYFHTRARIM